MASTRGAAILAGAEKPSPAVVGAAVVGAAVVVIDGEIGAGKTTLLEHVRAALEARGLRVAVVPEPVDEWRAVGILEAFYADKPAELRGHVAYEFQTYTFVTRVRKTMDVVAANPAADVYLLERSVLTDRFVFMELQREMVGPLLMRMYEEWWDMWARAMPIRPTQFVYLKPTLDNCQGRVAARGRAGEVADLSVAGAKPADEADRGEASARGGVSAAYQARLRRAHEAYLQGLHADEFPGMPPRPFAPEDVVVVDGRLADDDFAAPGPAADRVAEFIAGKIEEARHA